jgi:hypothetical protein
MDVEFRKEVSLLENFLDRHEVHLRDMLLVQQPDAANRFYWEERPIIAKHFKDALVLAHEDHTNDLRPVGHGDPDRDAELGVPDDLAHVSPSFRLSGGLFDWDRATYDGPVQFSQTGGMMRPKPPKDGRGEPDPAPSRGVAAHPEPETIFDPDLFEELCGMIGTMRMCVALEDLASALQQTFPKQPDVEPDRERTFQMAHLLTGRAGLMGFTALRDACVKLQEACATQAPFGEEYARTCRISLPTQEAIASLLKRLS